MGGMPTSRSKSRPSVRSLTPASRAILPTGTPLRLLCIREIASETRGSMATVAARASIHPKRPANPARGDMAGAASRNSSIASQSCGKTIAPTPRSAPAPVAGSRRAAACDREARASKRSSKVRRRKRRRTPRWRRRQCRCNRPGLRGRNVRAGRRRSTRRPPSVRGAPAIQQSLFSRLQPSISISRISNPSRPANAAIRLPSPSSAGP